MLIPPARAAAGAEPATDSTARQVFRKKLREGSLDDKDIEIDLTESRPQVELMGPAGMEEMTEQLRGMFSQMGQDKRKTRKLKIAEALKRALAMELPERIARWAQMFESITRDDVSAWRDAYVGALSGGGETHTALAS